MGYRYDPQNGYRDADQLNADEEEYNVAVAKAISGARECERGENNPDKATRNCINNIALSRQEEKEESNQRKEKTEEIEKPEMPSYYIAASIKEDIKKEEKNEDFEK